MNYIEASKIVTHKHELAKLYSRDAAEFDVQDMNWDRPAAMTAFRAEECSKCNGWHIRRGPNVFIKART